MKKNVDFKSKFVSNFSIFHWSLLKHLKLRLNSFPGQDVSALSEKFFLRISRYALKLCMNCTECAEIL